MTKVVARRNVAAKGDACSSCCHCLGCSCYKWRAYGGALFWSRTSPGGGVVVEDAYGDTLLESNDYDFGWSNGWEAGVIRRVNRCWGVEGRFFRIDSFDAVYPSFYSPYGASVQYYDPMTTQSPATITSSYHSELTNCELNLRRAITCKIDLVFGFRYMQLNDRYQIGITSGSEIYNQTEHNIHAYNNLYGFHMGPDVCLWNRGCFCVDWGARFGVYGNRIQTGVDIESSLSESTATYSCRAEQDHTAFSAEMTLAGTYCWSDCLSVRFGYQLMWLEGVAEATAQLASSQPARVDGFAGIDTDGSPFYHGAFVDAVLTW